ncbi:hypothetical protein DAEQUDRAFT_813238 [Daedalea quercina L-15889]|uniref:C2H2-type domain-containing protein n=1 Tax=Daedalea quercina L-15889 TaxID=1314783 RepID=A0A165NGM9_9APHY|nr:hypothetical protein DAEQUDRAFT_813238 [Daedalea quercina L-15889]
MFEDNTLVDPGCAATYSYSFDTPKPAEHERHFSANFPQGSPALPFNSPQSEHVYVLESFAEMVRSSTALPPEADRILRDIHTFVSTTSSAVPYAVGNRFWGTLPRYIEGHGAQNIDRFRHGPAPIDGTRCLFNNCRIVLQDTTNAGVARHLLDHHFTGDRTQWEKSDERIHCLWIDCRHRGTLKKRSLAKHICTAHLRTTEVKCDVPGCDAVLSREDGRKRHTMKVHGALATPRRD